VPSDRSLILNQIMKMNSWQSFEESMMENN
jgi:hypothetical protein